MHLAEPCATPHAPSFEFELFLKLLVAFYVKAEAVEPQKAMGIAGRILYDVLTDEHARAVKMIGEDCLVSAARRWDPAGIIPRLMDAVIKSHFRSWERLIMSIAYRCLEVSRNRIFLEGEEIAQLLAVSSVVGYEIRRLLPETADAWLEEMGS